MLAVIIGFILFLAISLGLGSLIFWGLGSLIIWVFKINFVWTIWHGLVCQIIFLVLKQIFGGNK